MYSSHICIFWETDRVRDRIARMAGGAETVRSMAMKKMASDV